MEFLSDFADPAEDRGTPVLLQRAAEPGGEDAYMNVRRIPSTIASQIEFRHSGRKTAALMKKAGALMTFDNEVSKRETQEKAEYALVDTTGFDVRAADAGAAAFYSKLFGKQVGVGELVRLDGKWSPEVKKRVFEASPIFARRVVAAAVNLDVVNQVEEEGKEES